MFETHNVGVHKREFNINKMPHAERAVVQRRLKNEPITVGAEDEILSHAEVVYGARENFNAPF